MKKAQNPEKIIKTPGVAFIANYIDKWVALSEDYKKVIASGDTLQEVLKKISDRSRAMVIKVLPNVTYAPAKI